MKTGLNAISGGIAGEALGLLGGLFGKKQPDQAELQRQAWEYEKEGMGLQYQYGQQAADAQQKRNLEMWNATNYEAQREHMEKAGLSVGLMYGQGGGGGATAAGGQPTQPSGMGMNPVQAALQAQAMGIQIKQIEAQNRLANAQTAKTYAEAGKIAGVDTDEAKTRIVLNQWDAKLKEIGENIAANDYAKGMVETQIAAEELRKAMTEADISEATKETVIGQAIQNLQNSKAQGALTIANKELTEEKKKLVEKQVENYFYEVATQRMSAEAAKEQARNTAESIAKTYEMAGKKLDQEQTKMIGDWIAAGIGEITSIFKVIKGVDKFLKRK